MATVSQGTLPPQRGKKATHCLSTIGRDGKCRIVRDRYARRYQVNWPGCGYQAGRADAIARAQQIADQEGQPINIWDAEYRQWLPPVQPQQHLCFNKACRAPLMAEEHPESYRTGRCRHCAPAAEGS